MGFGRSASRAERKRSWQANSQAEDAARDLAPLLEALIGVGVLLLAVEESDVLRAAPDRDVLGRRHQHRRRRDRLPRGVHRRAARRHRCGRGRALGAPGLGDLREEEVGAAGRADPDEKVRRGGDDGGEGEVVTATLSASFVPSWASECETTGLHVGSFCRVYVYREFGIFDNAPFVFVTSSARFQRPL